MDIDRGKKEIADRYIKNIVSSIGNKNNNFVFIKHYGQYNITLEDARNVMMSSDNIEVYYTHFGNNEIVGSFEPFLTIIKNCYIKYYSDITIDEFLSKFDIYQLQRFFFKSYIDSGTCERDEPYIIDEIGYEKKRIVESVASIVIELSKMHPMLIMIDNVHNLPQTTISLFRLIFDNPNNKNIGVFAAYNDLKKVTSVNRSIWTQFVNTIIFKKFMFELGAFDSKDDTEERDEFVFDSKRAYEYLSRLKVMYCAVDLEQAHYYLQKIYDKFSNEQMVIDFKCKFEILKLYAQVLIYLEDFATSLLICDNLKEMCDIEKSPELEFDYHMLYVYTQVYNGRIEYARKSVSECKRIASEIGNEDYIFKAEMMKIMFESSGWHNVIFLSEDISISDDFIKKLQKYNYYNHLAYIYVYAYHNDFAELKKIKTREEFETKLVKFGEGIEIAKKIGNTFLICRAYNKIVMMTSSIGLFEITEYYYEKHIEYLEPEQEIELANIKNGQGYICCASRKFEKSNECYNVSLDIFIRNKDMERAGETLYNMAVNCILAEDFNSAYNYLKTGTVIIEKMRLNDLRVCNIAKLYGLLALCSVRLSYEYDSLMYLNTNRKFLKHVINYLEADGKRGALTGNDDELFLYYFVSGLIEEKRENNDKALEYYKRAYTHCLNSLGYMFFSFVQLKVAMANVYRKLGDEDSFVQMIDEACSFANEKGYSEQVKLLIEMKQTGKYVQESMELPLKNHTLDKIYSLIEKESTEMQNKDMRSHMEFISIWQNVIEINNRTREELINTAASSFMLNYNLDLFLFLKFEKDSSKVMFCDGPVNIKEQDIEILKDYFETYKTGFVTAMIDKNYDEYQKILQIFGKHEICSLVCTPFYNNERLDSLFISCIYVKANWNIDSYRYLLNEDEANIFRLVLRQFLIAIDKIDNINKIQQINEALKQSSFTDYLTGLRNRNGFYDEINRLILKSNNKNDRLDLAILYIDLDNFKYYNDTFGHDVGDLVLKETAKILDSMSSEKAFAVRYGGDEFIIVLIDSNKEEAMATARMILDEILAKNGYVNEISGFLGKKVIIKREKMLSCSIGVATSENINSGDKLAELIQHADTSLYSVKHTTKNAVKFFE